MMQPWRTCAIFALDALDHYVLRHRIYRVCTLVAQSSWWDGVTDAQDRAYKRRVLRWPEGDA